MTYVVQGIHVEVDAHVSYYGVTKQTWDGGRKNNNTRVACLLMHSNVMPNGKRLKKMQTTYRSPQTLTNLAAPAICTALYFKPLIQSIGLTTVENQNTVLYWCTTNTDKFSSC